MGIIRVLPDQIANKIAAGEVVERPASVVKELLENALDSGATQIAISVEAGGKSRIRVTDNGCGMVADDALLALERHATSKLRDAESLSAIATLGFRGEALPAIASVCRFGLETSTAAGPGTRLSVHAGKLHKVEEIGAPAGTSVVVENLFGNIPARKKFLKSDATELGHITTLVTHYALAYPEIQFRLDTPHRELLSLPPASHLAERLRQVLGDGMMNQCVEFRETAEWAPEPEATAGSEADPGADPGPGLGLYGFASRPELQKLNRNSIFIFVNRRLVRDRLLQHAVSAAYYNLLPRDIFPAVLLFVDLPYGEVDVNVHPSKTEVRFRRQTFVHDAVRDVIRRALAEARPVPSFLREREARASASPSFSRPWSEPIAVPYSPGVPAELGISSADLPPGFALTPAPVPPRPQRLELDGNVFGAGSAAPAARYPAAPGGGFVPETGAGCGLREYTPPPPSGADELAQLQPLGQVRDSFIVASGPSGLWLVDQHVAHERVLFEQIGAQRLAGAVESQRLLLPLIIRLEPGRFLGFAELAPELEAAGFEAEVFGRDTIAVKAAPAGIRAEQVERLLQELIEVARPEERGVTITSARTRITATIACHAAIKINQKLEPEKMLWLLRALAATEYPMTCPHGRPVLLRYGLDEIQRAFKRIS